MLSKEDIEATKNWLERIGKLDDSYQKDLIEDAIYCGGYSAERSLKTMAANYRNSGDYDAAEAVERLYK